MDTARRTFSTCSLALFVLTACGGGSGGSNPSQPVPPGGTVPGAITQANAESASIVGVAMLEAPVQLALAGINPFINTLDAGLLQQTIPCGSGNIDTSVFDNDGSADVSSGDEVLVGYTGGCFSEILNAPVDGEFQLTIHDAVLKAPGSLVLRARLSFPGGLAISEVEPVTVSGGFEIAALVRSVTLELLTISIATPDQLSISIGSGSSQVTETISGLSLRRRVLASENGGRPLLIEATSAIQSELLGTTIQCRTDDVLATPDALDWPRAGALECVGAAGSAVRLASNGGSGESSPVSLLVDPEGDETFVGVNGGPFSWDDFAEGELFTERVSMVNSIALPVRPLLQPLVTTIPLNGLVYAPNRNRLFGTTDTSVVEIDPETLAITRSVDVPGAPGAVAVSADETTLWIGLDDSSELQRIDLVTMTAGPAFPLGNSVPGGFPRTAHRIRVAPGTAALVVLTTTSSEMLAFNGGVQLPDAIDDTTLATLPPEWFVFRNAADIAGISGSVPSTVYRIKLHPVTGLSVERTMRAMAGESPGHLQPGAADIYVSGGRIFNEISESIEGELRPDFCCYDDLAVDPQSGQIFALDEFAGDNMLDLYTENNRVRIGEYSLPVAGLGIRPERALLTDDYLFFTRADDLERYARDDIVANLPDEPCDTLDLGGLLVDGTYIMLDCALTDVVFDPDRNLLYAGLDDYTSRGNSIAVIDSDSLEVVSHIPLGAPPGMLKLSPDSATLFVNLAGTSKYAEVDLDTQVIRRVVILGFDGTGAAYVARALAASPGTDGDVLISMNMDVALFNDGSPVGNFAQFRPTYSDLFASEDGASAFAQRSSSSGFDIFNVSSSGVAFLQTAADASSFFPADQEGRFIDSPNGRRFDTITHGIEVLCTPSLPTDAFEIRVGNDPFSDRVYFAAIGNRSVLNTEVYSFAFCDPEGAMMSEETEAFVFKFDEGSVQTVLPLPNDRIVLQTDTHLVLLDRTF